MIGHDSEIICAAEWNYYVRVVLLGPRGATRTHEEEALRPGIAGGRHIWPWEGDDRWLGT